MKATKEGEAVWQELKDFVEADPSLEDCYNEFLNGEGYGLEEFKDFPYELSVVGQDGCWNDGGQVSITVKIGDHFFQKKGYYSSWGSHQWENFSEVKPVEVTRIEYVAI